MARGAPSPTGRSRKARSSWPGTGCGTCARWTRQSSGSSEHHTTGGLSRSVRSPSTRAHEGTIGIATEAHHAIETIWRMESARLVAGLARLVGDIGTAEELAQDALVAALRSEEHTSE